MWIDAHDNGVTGTVLKLLPQRSPARRIVGAAILAALAALALAPQRAQAGPTLLMDLDSGRVLHQSGAFVRWYPASLTKLMTAYVVLKTVKGGRLSFATPIPISELALSQAPSKMGFPVGTQVTIGDALKMLMVHSANDIAVALAEGVAGSVPAFVTEMNLAAYRLGMTDSRFTNPNGLPEPGQMTTARDLALLARALRKEFPDEAGLFDIRAIRIAGRVMRNHNHLIERYPGVDGMKTGYICSAGYNVVATAKRGSKHLVAVVLGARSGHQRSEIAAALFEDGFGRPFFDFSGERIETLPRPAEPVSADPIDMKPIQCGVRRKKGKNAPPLPPEPVPFDARINIEAGRQALAKVANGEAPPELMAQVAAQAAVPPIQVSAVIPANAVQPSLPAGGLAEGEDGEAKKPIGKAPGAKPVAASAFAAPKLSFRKPVAAKAEATETKAPVKSAAVKGTDKKQAATPNAKPKPAAKSEAKPKAAADKRKPAKKDEAKS